MQKASVFLFVFFLGAAFSGSSQTTTPADFFAGKWDILVKGTPNGDAKFSTNLIRENGKLVGKLTTTEAGAEPIPITEIEEAGDKVSIFFTAQGYDLELALSKVDDDTLNGTLMNMFEASAKRVKE